MLTTQGAGRRTSSSGTYVHPCRGIRRRSDAGGSGTDIGATLVEILVSMVLLGLLGTSVLTTLAMATRNSARSGDLAAEQSALSTAHDLISAQPYIDCADGDPAAAHRAATSGLGVDIVSIEHWDGTRFTPACVPNALQRITLRTGHDRTLQIARGSREDLPHPPPPPPPPPTEPPAEPEGPVPVCSVTSIVGNAWWQDAITIDVANTTDRSYEQDEWRVELSYPGSGYPQNEGHYTWSWSGTTLQLVPSGTWLHLHRNTARQIRVLEPPASMTDITPADIGCRVVVAPITPVFDEGVAGASCAVTAHLSNPHWQDQLTVTVTNRSGAVLRYHHWMVRLSYQGSGREPNGHYTTTWDGDRVTFVPAQSWIEIPDGGSRQFVVREPAGSTATLSAAGIPCIVGVPG